MWIDNFATTFKFGVPTLMKGVWKACLWSVWGAIGTTIKVNLSLLPDKPAMPRNLLSLAFVNVLKEGYQTIFQESWRRFDGSWCREAKRIPLGDEPALKSTTFYPIRMTDANPASNQGLAKLLAAFTNEHHKDKQYKILLVDINLFMRLIKVLFFHFS